MNNIHKWYSAVANLISCCVQMPCSTFLGQMIYWTDGWKSSAHVHHREKALTTLSVSTNLQTELNRYPVLFKGSLQISLHSWWKKKQSRASRLHLWLVFQKTEPKNFFHLELTWQAPLILHYYLQSVLRKFTWLNIYKVPKALYDTAAQSMSLDSVSPFTTAACGTAADRGRL